MGTAYLSRAGYVAYDQGLWGSIAGLVVAVSGPE